MGGSIGSIGLMAGARPPSADYRTLPLAQRTVVDLASGSLQYHSEPQMVEANDGSIVMAYKRDSGHATNNGYIAVRKSAANGHFWSAESVAHDAASGYFTGNPSIGKDAASGRLILFTRTYNFPSTSDKYWFQTSADHGVAWSAPTDITATVNLPGDAAPFGGIVATANGLMQLFYKAGECVALFSTDGGQTWGSRTVVYTGVLAPDLNEPIAVAVTSNDIVVVARRDGGGNNSFAFYKSTNGGSTWASAGVGAFSADSIEYAAPAWVAMNAAGQVVTAWITRHHASSAQANRFYVTTMSAAAYLSDPTDSVDGAVSRIEAATLYRRYGSISSGTIAEYGYPNLLQIGGGRMFVAWYDMSDGTNTRTRICIMSLS